MGILDKFKGWVRGVPRGISFFSFTGDGCTPGYTVDLTSGSGVKEAYDRCGTLKTVVNRNAQAMSNGRWWIVDDKDNDVSAHYKDIMRLLTKPNPLQTFTEFTQQMDVYRQLKGGFYIYAPSSVGFSGPANAKAMWVVDPDYIEVEYTGKLFLQTEEERIISRYWLTVGSEPRTELKREDLLYVRDVNQNLAFAPSKLKGESRLSGVAMSIANLVIAEEALYALNKQRGPMGILTNEKKDVSGPIALTDSEKKQVQDDLINGYGLSLSQAKIIVTDASLKWQPISYSVADLKLFDGMDKNMQLVCDAFDYPYELLGGRNGITYENKKEAKKSHYDDSIIPISLIYAQSFTEYFGLDLKNHKIVVDFEHLPLFKTAEKDKASALSMKVNALTKLYQLGAISMEELRLGLEYDEKVYGKTMYGNGQGSNSQTQEAQGAEGQGS